MILEFTCFFLFFWGVWGGAHVTKYQPDPKSHCSRRGMNYAMSLYQLSIASIPTQKTCEKINMNSDIHLSTLTFL